MRRQKLSAIVVAVAFFAEVSNSLGATNDALVPQWREIGPSIIADADATGRIESIFLTDGTIIVGAANGGVWRRSLEGGTWTPVGDTLPSLALGQVATDGFALFAATGEAFPCIDCAPGTGVFRSDDNGTTWQRLVGFPIQRSSGIIVDGLDPAKQVILVSGWSGVYRSVNGGLTAERVFDARTMSLAVDPTSKNVIYLGSETGISKSTDTGATWTPLDVSLVRMRPLAGTSETYNVAIAVAPSKPSRVYASFSLTNGYNNGCLAALLKSDDSGLTWSMVGQAIENGASSAEVAGIPDYFAETSLNANWTGCQGWYDSAIAVDPNSADHVVVGGVSLFESRNGGGTWRNLTFGTRIHADVHALAFARNGRLVIGTDGGVWTIASDGSATSLNRGLAVTQFWPGASRFSDGSAYVVGTQDNGTNVFTELASTTSLFAWRQIYGGDGGYTAVDPSNSQILYAEYVKGDVVRTDDGGTTWNYTNPGRIGLWVTPFMLHPDDSTKLLVGLDQLWLGDQRGSGTWVQLTDVKTGNGKISAISAGPSGSSALATGWNSGLILAKINGGPWIPSRPSSAPVADIKMNPVDPKEIYAAFRVRNGDGVLPLVMHTTDTTAAPVQWENVTGDLPSAPNVLHFRNGSLYVGCDDGVYRKASGTTHWSRIGRGLPAASVVAISNHGNGFLVATHGRGAWRLDTIP